MIVVVEGKTDKNFLIAYLEFLEKGAHSKYLKTEDKNILVSGGKDGLKNNDDSDDNTKDSNVSTKIKKRIQEGEKILIIFDADNNYEESKQNIEKQLKELFKELGVEAKEKENYDIFLMPNNKDKGTLEDLFEKIAKCKDVLKCFDKYCKCIKIVQKKSMQEKESTEVQIRLPPPKTKIYAYFQALGCIIEENKGKKFKIDDRFFDLENEYLKPLKNFLKQ